MQTQVFDFFFKTSKIYILYSMYSMFKNNCLLMSVHQVCNRFFSKNRKQKRKHYLQNFTFSPLIIFLEMTEIFILVMQVSTYVE